MVDPKRAYWSAPVMEYDSQEQVILSEDHGTAQDQDKPNISIKIIEDIAAFRSLEEEWDGLTLKSSATIFQTFDWQYQWWRNFGSKPEHHLLIVLFKSENRLVGIAPLFVQSFLFHHFRFFARLMLLGSGLQKLESPVLSLEQEGPSDYLDLIVDRGSEKEVAEAFVAFIEHESHLWDEIDFQNIRDDGITFNYVLPLLTEHKFLIEKNISDVCPKVLLPESWDKFIPSMRPKVRRNLRYAQRGYLQDPEFIVQDACEKGNLASAMESLSTLHQKRWNAVGYPGLFSDKRFDAFQHDVTKVLAKKGRLWFKTLRHKEKVIVAHLGFKFNGRTYSYLSGYDRGETCKSPGNPGAGSAVLLVMIEDAIKSNCQVLDLGRGEESYKYELTADVTRNWEIKVRHPKSFSKSRFVPFMVYSSYLKLASRVKCEILIMKIIGKEKGAIHVFPDYFSHLVRRLTKSRKSFNFLSWLDFFKLGRTFSSHPQKKERKE